MSGKFKRAPLGTNNFSKNIDIDSNIVFIGNGIVKKYAWNCYQEKKGKNISGEIDVTGKIVLFCYDFPDSIEEKTGKLVPLKSRIAEAKSRNARAVIVFSSKKEYPLNSYSGSFIRFLVDKYGLKSVMEAYILEGRSSQDKKKENTWQKVYGKSLKSLEEEWLYWLAEQYNVDKEHILTHLKK